MQKLILILLLEIISYLISTWKLKKSLEEIYEGIQIYRKEVKCL